MKSYMRVISNVLVHSNLALNKLAVLGLFAILVACSGDSTLAQSDRAKNATPKNDTAKNNRATSDMISIDISIELDPQQLERGHVVISTTLKNTSTDRLIFLPWGTPFETKVTAPFLKIHHRTADEPGDVPYVGMMLKRAAPVADDYINLGPGRSIKNRLDITESYRFCENRSYVLIYSGPLFQNDFSEITFSPPTIEFETGQAFSACTSAK